MHIFKYLIAINILILNANYHNKQHWVIDFKNQLLQKNCMNRKDNV